jgi:hypothetical protein
MSNQKTGAQLDPQQELKELQKKLKEKERQIEQLEMKTKNIDSAPSNEMLSVIEDLKHRLDEVERAKAVPQTVSVLDSKKSKYTPPRPEDILSEKDAVTFTARNVMYIMSGYQDDAGIDRLPPHKLIIFRYAASDMKQDGPEATITNFCQYTTRLKTEIDFLRNAPQYGLMYSDNMNEVANYDQKEHEFRGRVSQEIAGMSPETIYQHAQQQKIPGWQGMASNELRRKIADNIVKEYLKEAETLRKDRLVKMKLEQVKSE